MVYGAGAVGGVIGAHLHLAGLPTTLVARGDHLHAIREHGLQLDVFGPGATVLASHPRIAAVARKAGLAVQELRADPEAVAQAWRHWAAA